MSRTTWDNAASQLLERTLDDSANRRVVIPEMFLAIDEMLSSATKIIDGLTINDKRITKNMDTYWPFSATESIILEAVKKGADRQKMHEVLREISLKAEEGNSMQDLLESNPEIAKFLKPAEIDQLLDAKNHVGNAPKKALELVGRIKKI